MLDTLVVIPCFNEASRLDPKALQDAAQDDPRLGFVMVDDGSKDETLVVLRELASAAPERFDVLALEHNVGKAEAVRQGILAAAARKPSYVGYWDADLATPCAEIATMRGRLEEDDRRWAVMGSRIRRLGSQIERRPARHYAGRVFSTFAALVLSLRVYDTQCGAKIFRANPAVLRSFEAPFDSRWIFDIELIARLIQQMRAQDLRPEDALYEEPLSRWTDVAGSKLSSRDAVRALAELLSIARRYRPGR